MANTRYGTVAMTSSQSRVAVWVAGSASAPPNRASLIVSLAKWTRAGAQTVFPPPLEEVRVGEECHHHHHQHGAQADHDAHRGQDREVSGGVEDDSQQHGAAEGAPLAQVAKEVAAVDRLLGHAVHQKDAEGEQRPAGREHELCAGQPGDEGVGRQ